MNTKSYLKTFLFLAAIFLLLYSGKSQSSSDSIIIKKKWGTSYYYQNDVELEKGEVMQLLLNENETAAKLMKNSNNLRGAAYLFVIPGSVCVGFALGYLLANSGNKKVAGNATMMAPLLAGAGALGIGIIFAVVANDKAHQAIAVYNKSKKQSNTTLDLGLYPNGMMVRLNF